MTASASLRRVIIIALLASLALGRPTPAADNAPRSPEYLIKAAYLSNFPMFVEWPSEVFASPDAPVVICVVGADPFGLALNQTVENKRISKRRIAIERLQPTQDLRHCHVLFVALSEGSRAVELMQRLQGLPILIVDDALDGVRRGGTVDFLVDNNKVGFAINLDVAKRARLTISSKMLGSARAVR